MPDKISFGEIFFLHEIVWKNERTEKPFHQPSTHVPNEGSQRYYGHFAGCKLRITLHQDQKYKSTDSKTLPGVQNRDMGVVLTVSWEQEALCRSPGFLSGLSGWAGANLADLCLQ